VTFIRGDGTGPELADATARVLEATGVEFEWDWQEAGSDVYEAEGNPLPERVLESIRRNKIAIKAPITTPVGSGFRSVNVALRKDLDLYCCLRPCKAYEGVRTRFPETDIVIVRENHEDLYAGIEFEQGSEEARRLRETVRELSGKEIREDAGISIKPISIFGTRRIVRSAFEYARANGRRRVSAVHKATVMRATDGLFLDACRAVAAGYEDLEFDDRLVDNACAKLVMRPRDCDVLVMPMLYGDIVSDVAAGLVGGLGVAPGVNLGDEAAVFEAVHGSAPRHGGRDRANPFAMMLSGAMMLRHLGEADAAARLEQAIAGVTREGRTLTYDLARDGRAPASTSEVAEAVVARLR
jgi:isocitrate dehydrogenase (NAD+)